MQLRRGTWGAPVAFALAMVIGCSSSDGSSSNTNMPGVGDGEMPGSGAKSDLGGGTADAASHGTIEGPAMSGAVAPVSAGSGGGTSTAPPSVPTGSDMGSAGSSAGVPATVVGGVPPSTDPGIAPGDNPAPPPGPGLLTAGAWDDNRNFDRFLSFRDDEFAQQVPGLLPITVDEQKASLGEFKDLAGPKQTLDVSFVIDTTGSMGDELAYLQAEFVSISDQIHAKYPNAQQRWSLVVYRDVVDEYVVRWFDFRTDAVDFQTNLAAQSASGGGDFPESPERGIEKMNELAWRTDPGTARIAFWVADAPHHAEQAGALADALRDSKQLGVHVYPVAASGVDDFTELTMRTGAQLTGGRYLFLTNDSGIGGDHKEPRIPCYFVTHLNDAMLRMVDVEMTGVYREPTAGEIVRTGGNPKDGACTLDSGEQVVVF